jgi:hypothetical protein
MIAEQSLAGREEVVYLREGFMRLQEDGFVRLIAALHAYHVVMHFGEQPDTVHVFLDLISGAYRQPDDFTQPWLAAHAQKGNQRVLAAEARDRVAKEVLGLNRPDLLCSVLNGLAEKTAGAMIKDPNWAAIVDEDLWFFGF